MAPEMVNEERGRRPGRCDLLPMLGQAVLLLSCLACYFCYLLRSSLLVFPRAVGAYSSWDLSPTSSQRQVVGVRGMLYTPCPLAVAPRMQPLWPCFMRLHLAMKPQSLLSKQVMLVVSMNSI